jgi:hypothetical protein
VVKADNRAKLTVTGLHELILPFSSCIVLPSPREYPPADQWCALHRDIEVAESPAFKHPEAWSVAKPRKNRPRALVGSEVVGL